MRCRRLVFKRGVPKDAVVRRRAVAAAAAAAADAVVGAPAAVLPPHRAWRSRRQAHRVGVHHGGVRPGRAVCARCTRGATGVIATSVCVPGMRATGLKPASGLPASTASCQACRLG
eukprot:363369-Chlamydomonas_euryale.AAC.13